jgi:hypothetical protein
MTRAKAAEPTGGGPSQRRAAPRKSFIPTIIDAIGNEKLFARWFRDPAT